MTETEFNSDLLKSWGHKPGKAFGQALAVGQEALTRGESLEKIRSMLEPYLPAPRLDLRQIGEVPFEINIEAESGDQDEVANIASVKANMTALMRTPTVEFGAIMPDACPAGPMGTIPVGGVVATCDAIHPGMHSADICCSVMISNLGKVEPKAVLDAAHEVTHFGMGGRSQGRRFTVSQNLVDAFRENRFLNNPRILRMMHEHMGTQGDGNHFLFVGRSRKTGDTCIVTHHGSRGPGAMLYKAGMAVAERYRRELSPMTLKQNAWIPANSEDGRDYWKALQLIRKWTKANHTGIQQAAVEALGAELKDRFWNEHNFVFERNGLYYHGKGATPAFEGFASDATDFTLIPLNMSQPVLVVRGQDTAHGLGFSPHGAGRNFSRSEHKRRNSSLTPDELLKLETDGLDIRFYEGKVDISELPSGYKNADSVVSQIKKFGLAEIDDFIDPYGCVMAGDIEPVWKTRKRRKQSNRA